MGQILLTSSLTENTKSIYNHRMPPLEITMACRLFLMANRGKSSNNLTIKVVTVTQATFMTLLKG